MKNDDESSGTPTADRKFCDDAVVLYIRSDNKKSWNARIKLSSGKWHRFSTKTHDFEKAKKIAIKKWNEIQHSEENNLVVVERKFANVARTVKRDLLEEYEISGDKQAKIYTQIIDKYLIPLLGDYKCHQITKKVLDEFDDKRTTLLGKKPTQSTIANHNAILRKILNRAKNEGFLEKIPSIKHSGAPKEPRDFFNKDEWRALTRYMRKELNEAKEKIGKKGRNGIDTITPLSYEIKELTRDLAFILIHTGIRSGNEIMDIKWKNLSVVIDDGKENIQFFLPHTKTEKAKNKKGRFVIASEFDKEISDERGERYGVWAPLRRIASRFDDLKDLSFEELFEVDEYIFRLPSTNQRPKYERLAKSFVATLKRVPYKNRKNGLYVSADTGVTRSLYSLRHSFATFRLMDGWSYEKLRTQLGTSFNMLEQHYDDLAPNLQPNAFSGRDIQQQKRLEKQNEKKIAKLEKQNEQLLARLDKLTQLLEKQ